MINHHELYSSLKVTKDSLILKSHLRTVDLFDIVSSYHMSSIWLLPSKQRSIELNQRWKAHEYQNHSHLVFFHRDQYHYRCHC
jgi:hypothetical protein